MKSNFSNTRLQHTVREFLARLIFLSLLVGTGSASAGMISVSVEPESTTVGLNEQFSVDLWADIPASEPVLGWGLDLLLDETVLALRNVTLGSAWFGFSSPDNDGLAGLSFPPVSGRTLLATLQLEAVGFGSSLLSLSSTPEDTTEGFALVELNEFAGYEVQSSQVTVSEVPEPSIFALLGLGLAMLGFNRRKRAA